MQPDFETLLQIIQLAAKDFSFDLTRVVLASAEGEVWFLEVADGMDFRSQLELAYRKGGLALGLLGWEMVDEMMQDKTTLFPWHPGNDELCALFKKLCEAGVDSVQEELERGGVN